MTTTSLLVIGGTGQISAAVVRQALLDGVAVTVLNRGSTSIRPLPAGVEQLTADVRDEEAVVAALHGRRFDSVADYLTFTPEQLASMLRVVAPLTDQYIFIGSASAYQKPPVSLPITEATPLFNPWWAYSRDKIACERLLRDEHQAGRVQATVVRPSHTYDETHVPLLGGWTTIERMRRGDTIVLHGDGTSMWALTHSTDFARAFVALLGHPDAMGEAFSIMAPEQLTWNMIARDLADAAGAPLHLVHRTTHDITETVPEWTADLCGDRSHPAVFDTAKIRAIAPDWEARVPFAEGARQIVAWHDADPARRAIDPGVDAAYDRLVSL
ncbi:NAD-dependent epimerase/dehydratase family protein [Frigoribacterium sp. CFBP 13712]|uniref:NAD-dependent epimerase/dehydratase family protein n=1 Tax=Frigoribacterium sp. CFBP 13712 TaxID=2775309 RepID=UPI00177C32B1|nr:NAD-dependent epimerase/dehydratase family protein [Frigoribacterium sp. CFBP 13712]MBD8704255.1 NAD-dependent epimerase/dehydratase family protein [Frigoribacterium sp. CFBP 13712]